MNKRNFIIKFFEGLEKSNIDHCILRNYEMLPDEVGHDIDMLVDGKDKHEEIKIKIISLVEKLGWEQICNYDRDSFFTIICIKITQDNVETLKLDIWTDLCWRGISWIDTKIILDNRRKFNGFFVPGKACEAAITSLKELMGGGNVPEKYYEKIVSNAIDNPRLLVSVLTNSFGDLSKVISEKLIEGDFQSLNLMGNKLKNKLIYDNFNIYLKSTVQRISLKVMDKFDSSGKLIAFIGPDGSGKTSIIDLEEEYLKLVFPKIIKYHIRFNIFPELRTGFGFSSMKGKLTNDEERVNVKNNEKDPIKRSLISKLASWFVVIYYSFEFLIGRVIIKKHKLDKSLILFDRYYYDFFAQPTTRDLIKKHKKLLIKFAKKPDIVIHLNANPQIVYKRKQELSINEIEKQNYYLKTTIEDLDYAYTINTDIKTEREIASEVFRIILDYIKKNH